MKRNQNFDHNHSQKLLSFRYNIDTNRVEARFTDGSAVANRMPNCLRTSSTRYFTVGLTRRIECHRFFMATAEYTQLVLSGEIEHYLSLGCDHGRLED